MVLFFVIAVICDFQFLMDNYDAEYVLFSPLDNIGHFLANVNAMSSPVCLSSVTLVHPTHATEIFRNVSSHQN